VSPFATVAGDPGSPWILHVPHASSAIPAAVRERIVLDDDALAAELRAMTDAHTDLLAARVADLVRGPLTYAEVQREKGIVGTPDSVAERLRQLRDEAQLAGISAEINPGSMLSHAQVMSSLRLWCQDVMPRFK